MDNVIELKNIYKYFRTKDVETIAVNDVNVSIKRGEYIAIAGPSGSGKSTLLSILGLLSTPCQGEYNLKNTVTGQLNKNQLASLRNKHIGYVFQSFNLIDSYSVLDNVKLPLVHRKGLSKSEVTARARQALEKVDMSHRLKHYPAQLSGGQQQRVAIARCIVTDPSIILADEPTGNLDSSNAEMVMKMLKEQHDNGCTICIVTHDPRYVIDATRIISIVDGKIVD